MGTALRFNEEARACYVAQRLALKGYGVLWDPAQPNVVMTSCSKAEVREITKAMPGVVEAWWKEDKVDVDIRRYNGDRDG